MPEFQDDEGDDLLAVDKLPRGAHLLQEMGDLFRIEVASVFDGGFVEGVGDQGFELGLVEEVLDREVEGDLFAPCDVRGEDFVG